MGNMEFCLMNYLNTSTLASITSGTTSVSKLYDRNNSLYWTSNGDNSDLTTTTIRIGFASSKNISRIILEDINLKSFKIYYNSNTANLITLIGALTNASSWASNSETSLYLKFATLSVNQITIDMTATMIANQEKQIGEFWITDKYHVLEYQPDTSGFIPKFNRKQYAHEMSDGGSAVYIVQDNFKCSLKRDYVSSTEFTKFLGLYQLYDSFIFTPFPTGTAWVDENLKIYAVNWTNDFDFTKFIHNEKGLGYTGQMQLEEIAK